MSERSAGSSGRHGLARPLSPRAATDASSATGPGQSSVPTPHPLEENGATPDTSWAQQPAASGMFQPFGSELEPALRRACGDRLSKVQWFRTDWQRGGALTGYSTLDAAPVVVKLPVPPNERTWLKALQLDEGAEQPPAVPRLYADGERLNGYDLAWVVMERLPHGPLTGRWGGAETDCLIEAAGRFYERAANSGRPLPDLPVERDWYDIAKRSAGALSQLKPTLGKTKYKAWKQALQKAEKRLPSWLSRWGERPAEDLVHGDLHPGNAMSHEPAPHGPVMLIDLARTRRGHWVEDAVYLEHLHWADRDRLGGRSVTRQFAQERKRRNLRGDPGWAELANIRRGLLALAAPALTLIETDPAHLEASFDVLGQVLRS